MATGAVLGQHVHPDAGIRPAAARPMRAVALAWFSRAMLVVLALGAVLLVVRVLQVDEAVGADMVRDELARTTAVEGPATGPGGGSSALADEDTTPSQLIEAVVARTAGADARLLQLVLTARPHGPAEVRLRIVSASDAAAAIARVLMALEEARIVRPIVREVVPTAAGARLDIVGEVAMSDARTAPLADARSEHAVLDLADLVSAAGASLERLEMPTQQDGEVRLAVRSEIRPLVALLRRVELDHSAPLRFRELRVDRLGDEVLEVSTAFGLRPRNASVTVEQ
jgi:hypothetical protein